MNKKLFKLPILTLMGGIIYRTVTQVIIFLMVRANNG